MTSFQKEQIHRMRSAGMGYAKIAASLGISENTIKSYCRRNNLGGIMAASQPAQRDDEKETWAFCQNCGQPLKQRPGVKPRKFCSDACRAAWWKNHPDKVAKKAIYQLECAGCQIPFASYGNQHRKYCSHACYIKERFGKRQAGGDRHI